MVDDKTPIRRAMQKLLGAKHEVVLAASGREARALLEADRSFDVVLCDLMMPEVNGMELHAWLSTLDPALARRTIFVTGSASASKEKEYLAATGAKVITKPVDAAELLEAVTRQVARSRERPPPPAGPGEAAP